MQDIVIFLDFDGPLFSHRSLELPENNKETAIPICKKLDLHHSVNYWKMDPCAVAMFNKIFAMNENIKVVISSSWANPHFHEKQHIEALFDINGLKCKLHEDWRTPRSGNHRTEDISQWLNNHSVKNYLIFDDNESAPEMEDLKTLTDFNIAASRVLLVSINDGLSYSDYLIAKEMLHT